MSTLAVSATQPSRQPTDQPHAPGARREHILFCLVGGITAFVMTTLLVGMLAAEIRVETGKDRPRAEGTRAVTGTRTGLRAALPGHTGVAVASRE